MTQQHASLSEQGAAVSESLREPVFKLTQSMQGFQC
jgi:methyl-accepting chemotaxis protein